MKNKQKWIVIPGVLIVVLMVGIVIGIVLNMFNSDYSSLSKIDQRVLSELELCFSSEKEDPMWLDYKLSEKTIVAIEGRFGSTYIINPGKPIKSVFAKEIQMPDEYSISAYRIAATAPQLWQFRGLGNFNRLGSAHKLFGNDVYYTRYSAESVSERRFDSGHYLTFLAHEAFHYYMQTNWTSSGRFSTDEISDSDLDLLEEQYAVFEQIQQALIKETVDVDELKLLCREYVAVVERRLVQNPGFVNEELQAETEEGTATYVGIKASEAISYPFDIMCFERDGAAVEHLSFDTIIPAIKEGSMSVSFLSTNLVYETGALLCRVMEAVGVEDWQGQLNRQTVDNPVTLFSILKAFVNQ